ncbi:hypothetical protein FQZ97_1029610 [compost metagenome]
MPGSAHAISPSMRMTSTTSRPVMRKERTAPGPADLMTTPLPTNRPAPITPPSAIMVMWRCLRPWDSPLPDSGCWIMVCLLCCACCRYYLQPDQRFWQAPRLLFCIGGGAGNASRGRGRFSVCNPGCGMLIRPCRLVSGVCLKIRNQMFRKIIVSPECRPSPAEGQPEVSIIDMI